MRKEIFDRYADIKILMKTLEAEAKEIAPLLLEEMGDIEELKSSKGTFVRGSRRTWEYPPNLKEEQDELDARKKTCQQIGEAKYTELPYLIFNSN